MATKRPSFLKRQKEQKRTARALEKREASRLKKQNRQTEGEESVPGDEFGELSDIIGTDAMDDIVS